MTKILTKNNTNFSSRSYPGEEYTDFYSIYYRIVDNEFVYSTGDDETPELVLQVFDPLGNEVTSIEGLEYVTTSDGVKGFDITTAQEVYPVSVEYEIVTDGTAPTVQEWTFVLFFMNLDTNQNVNAGKLFESDITIQHETRDLEGRPSISAISNEKTWYSIGDNNVETNSLFEAEYSENNGTTKCEPENLNELQPGTHIVSCTAIDNNGYKSTEATKEIIITDELGDILLINESTSYNTLDSTISYIENKGKPNFSVAATTDEGLYATDDDYGTSYYYRGAVIDNWVEFAGFYWRIIRIDGSGNIKLIYSGSTKPTSNVVSITGSSTHIGTSYWQDTALTLNDGNLLRLSLEGAGYVYSDGKMHGNDSDSLAKQKVDNWYNNNLNSYESSIATTSYCVDRTGYLDNIGTNISDNIEKGVVFAAAYRSFHNVPNLNCINKEDLVNLNVGLLSSDELILSGLVNNKTYSTVNLNSSPYSAPASRNDYANTNSFLYFENTAFTINMLHYEPGSTHGPCYLASHQNGYIYGGAYYNGSIGTHSGCYNITSTPAALYPTVSLKSDITITGGTGTGTDPYIIG